MTRSFGAAAMLGAILVLSAAKCPGGKAKPAAKPAGTAATGASAAAATTAAKGAKKSTIPDSADQAVYGMRVVLANQGVANGLLLSDTAYTYDDGSRLELHRVHLTFYTAQGVEDGTLVSKSGTYNSRLSRLEARGEVIVSRKDGRRLTTPKLVYDQAVNQIFTDSAFTLVEPSKQVSGIGFESDPKLTVFKCLRACKGVAPVQIPAK